MIFLLIFYKKGGDVLFKASVASRSYHFFTDFNLYVYNTILFRKFDKMLSSNVDILLYERISSIIHTYGDFFDIVEARARLL